MKLSLDFYQQTDVVAIARELLGKVLVTRFGQQYCSGTIVETEAYAGIRDRASHAFGGRMTARTRTMYLPGGVAYVYLCYGIHSLFNVVTNVDQQPDAVLVRGIIPLEGLSLMQQRAGLVKPKPAMGIGPGKVGKLMGFNTSYSGVSLLGNEIWIEDQGLIFSEGLIETGKRIGVEYAGEDANLPYRFRVKPNQNPGFSY